MIELSVVRDLVTIFGVIAGFSYYVLTVRNANKARQQTISRELVKELSSVENQRIFMELLLMDWIDFDDSLKKYDSTVNIDNYSKRASIWASYNSMGYELYKGNIDIETIYHLTGYQVLWFLWNKFKPIILGYRKRYGNPDHMKWLEYLVDELAKERMRQRLPADIIDSDGYITN